MFQKLELRYFECSLADETQAWGDPTDKQPYSLACQHLILILELNIL